MVTDLWCLWYHSMADSVCHDRPFFQWQSKLKFLQQKLQMKFFSKKTTNEILSMKTKKFSQANNFSQVHVSYESHKTFTIVHCSLPHHPPPPPNSGNKENSIVHKLIISVYSTSLTYKHFRMWLPTCRGGLLSDRWLSCGSFRCWLFGSWRFLTWFHIKPGNSLPLLQKRSFRLTRWINVWAGLSKLKQCIRYHDNV